ncbi:CD151 antigen-like [Saccostrea echinata]|uniref:CD151 antigen-like n=1 Tax=Saccostrea echinata TaxID=191078 RepID=UPI002A7F965C|nr:CD151 antigen-like [Saccostrea echinata]
MASMSLVKYVVVIFNFLFLLCGMGVAAMGAYTIANGEKVGALIGENLMENGAYLLLAAGGVVILVSMAGCFGALAENKCLLVLYFTVLLVTFIVEAAAGVIGFLFYGQLEPFLTSKVKDALSSKYGRSEYNLITLAVDELQMEFQCCGFHSPSDWNNATYFNSSAAVPVSCCVDRNVNGCNSVINNSTIYSQGCYTKMLTWIQANVDLLGGVGISVALFQLLGLGFTFCLCVRAGKDKKGGSDSPRFREPPRSRR